MRLLDLFKLAVAFIPDEDLGYGDPVSDYINMGKGQDAVCLIPVKGTTGTLTVTVRNASDASGTGAAAIAGRYRKVNRAGDPIDTIGDYVTFTSAGFTIPASADGVWAVEVRAEDLTTGKPFVSVKAAQGTAGAILGCGIWLLGGGRFKGPGAPSIVS